MFNSVFCTKPWTSFEISDHKGTVKPCCWSRLKCGNINVATVEQIWNGPGYVAMRQLMGIGEFDLICASDCPYRVGEHIDIHYPEPKTELFRQNYILQKQEILERKIFLESSPTIMSIVPTVQCNLNCIMCYLDHQDTVELPVNIQETLLSYYPVLQELWVVGGEPLIDRRCVEIIASMDPKLYPDLHLGLVTNGTSVTDKVETLLTNRQIAWILISIDAATSETYRRIRGGKLNQVVEGVKRLQSIRTKQNANWNLKIGFTLMRSNMQEVFAFVDLAKDLGVNCQFSSVFGKEHGESFYDNQTTVELAKQIVLELEDYLESKGFDRTRAARVWARLISDSSSFFDGDEPMDFNTWRVEAQREKGEDSGHFSLCAGGCRV